MLLMGTIQDSEFKWLPARARFTHMFYTAFRRKRSMCSTHCGFGWLCPRPMFTPKISNIDMMGIGRWLAHFVDCTCSINQNEEIPWHHYSIDMNWNEPFWKLPPAVFGEKHHSGDALFTKWRSNPAEVSCVNRLRRKPNVWPSEVLHVFKPSTEATPTFLPFFWGGSWAQLEGEDAVGQLRNIAAGIDSCHAYWEKRPG